MALNDIYTVKDIQTYLGQQVLNLYTYVMSADEGGTAEDLSNAWQEQMLIPITDMQSNALTHTGLEVVNLNNPGDFFSIVYSDDAPGAVSGDHNPPFVAYTFRLQRPSRLVRHGYKRIGGVPEAASTDGETLTPTYAALAATLAAAMIVALVSPDDDAWSPAILHRPGPGHPDPAASITHSASFSHFGSQNSRKIGRGA